MPHAAHILLLQALLGQLLPAGLGQEPPTAATEEFTFCWGSMWMHLEWRLQRNEPVLMSLRSLVATQNDISGASSHTCRTSNTQAVVPAISLAYCLPSLVWCWLMERQQR